MPKSRSSRSPRRSVHGRALLVCAATLVAIAIASAATADEAGRVYPDAESVQPGGVYPDAESVQPGGVYPDAESVQPLQIGAQVPHAELRTIDGQRVDVATLTAEQGALLVFYRGGW